MLLLLAPGLVLAMVVDEVLLTERGVDEDLLEVQEMQRGVDEGLVEEQLAERGVDEEQLAELGVDEELHQWREWHQCHQ